MDGRGERALAGMWRGEFAEAVLEAVKAIDVRAGPGMCGLRGVFKDAQSARRRFGYRQTTDSAGEARSGNGRVGASPAPVLSRGDAPEGPVEFASLATLPAQAIALTCRTTRNAERGA